MAHIYINTKQAEESRIVVVEDGILTGFEQEIAGRENRKGDIYKAVVVRIESGLDAAFVDFGDAKNGFLPLKDIAPGMPGATGPDGTLAEGDSILVQIKKDYSGGKGAGMTSFISLAGCYLVLNPVRGGRAHVSRRSDPQTREHLRRLVAGLPVPAGMSVIVRTAGTKQDAAALEWDLQSYLLKLWGMIEEAGRTEKGPALIYRENNILMRAARDYFNPAADVIICDDAESYEELRNFLALVHPDLPEDRLRFYDGDGPMITDGLEAKIDEIFEREVQTPSGARLVFDSTEAMVTVDVNSARMKGADNIEETALQSNLEAAEAIARHLRLRDLAGLIVVDFIDMDEEKNRKAVESRLRECFRKDRAQLRHTGISQLGLLEISRQRLARSVEDGHSLLCQRCGGTGRVRRTESLASSLLRRARVTAVQPQVSALLLQAPPEVAVYLLNEKRVALRRLEDFAECEILVLPDERLHPHEWRLRVLREQSGGNSNDLLHAAKRAAMPVSVDDRLRPEKAAPQPVLKRVMPDKAAPSSAASSPSPSSSSSSAQGKDGKDGKDDKPGGFWGWLKKLFGGDDDDNSGGKDEGKKPRHASGRHRRGGNNRGEGRGGEGRRGRGNNNRRGGNYRDNRDNRDNHRDGNHRDRPRNDNRRRQNARRSETFNNNAAGNGEGASARHHNNATPEAKAKQPSPKPAETANNKQADKPMQQPADKFANKPANNAADRQADKPANNAADKPADRQADKPMNNAADKPAMPKPQPKPAAKLPALDGSMRMVETAQKPQPSPKPQAKQVILDDIPPPATSSSPPKPAEQMRQVETGK